MTVSDFTENKKVSTILRALENWLKENPLHVSDITDKNGNQYVDLVQEGGGVLGIALVGYTWLMEQAGIRFRSVAGTSAGAINTLMLSAAGTIDEPRSQRVLKFLATKDLFDFVDGNYTFQWGLKRVMNDKAGLDTIVILLAGGIPPLRNKKGINPGKAVDEWFDEMLTHFGVSTTLALNERMAQVPEGFSYTSKSVEETGARMAIITAEITTKTKVEFPKMAGLYWNQPDEVNPAIYAKASMSIPYFFEPLVVSKLPSAGQPANELWHQFAGYRGEIPPSAMFVDGGLLSNFPINVFHRTDNTVPRLPTFGARLSNNRRSYSKNENILGMSGSMLNTMRQLHDYDFLRKNKEYNSLICHIDASEDYNWLDFNMSDEDKTGLFILGCERALEFLKTFDWTAYKKLRTDKN